MTNPEWVTLLKANDRLEAEILLQALEAQGIPTQLFQEGVAHYLAISVGPLSEIDICVPANRLEEAQAWLEEYENGELGFDESGAEA